ncbi:MAG: NAD-dependent epimerase/dehydratase family protein [Nitrospirae bacterium]|nr:NAD-dependent epimerase/dehydratase family protein [Nitrospirota bacterium]
MLTRTLLITGASGFLGTSILRALQELAPDIRVIAAGRTVGALGSPPVEGVPLDLASHCVVLPDGVDTVLHLAGEKHDESRMWAVNHAGTRRLVEAAANAGVRRFIYLSSVGVYGAPKHAGVVTKYHARTPRNTYEESKNAGEICVTGLCPHLGIEHLVVQPTNVIGHVPGRSYPLIGLMSMIQASRFAYFGSRDAWVNYVNVEDVAASVVATCQHGPNRAVYIVNTPTRLANVVSWIASELAVPEPRRRLPAWLGGAVGTAGSMLQRLVGRGMPFNADRYRELTNTTWYDGTDITGDLGFTYPIGIEQTVRDLVRAYRAEGRL